MLVTGSGVAAPFRFRTKLGHQVSVASASGQQAAIQARLGVDLRRDLAHPRVGSHPSSSALRERASGCPPSRHASSSAPGS